MELAIAKNHDKDGPNHGCQSVRWRAYGARRRASASESSPLMYANAQTGGGGRMKMQLRPGWSRLSPGRTARRARPTAAMPATHYGALNQRRVVHENRR